MALAPHVTGYQPGTPYIEDRDPTAAAALERAAEKAGPCDPARCTVTAHRHTTSKGTTR